MNAGVEHSINEMCNAWLMLVLKIAGGMRNIPKEKMEKVWELADSCTAYYLETIGHSKSNNMSAFWKEWSKICPEFFCFDQYTQFNPDKGMANDALRKANDYFGIDG